MDSYLDNFSKSFLEKKCAELDDELLKKEMPAPPHPGLVFNRQSHRWERSKDNRESFTEIEPNKMNSFSAYIQAKNLADKIDWKKYTPAEGYDFEQSLHLPLLGKRFNLNSEDYKNFVNAVDSYVKKKRIQ